jgi:hypothetical protein
VKRLQITIDLLRQHVRDRLRPKPLRPIEEDPLWKFAGGDPTTEPVGRHRRFLYGPRAET